MADLDEHETNSPGGRPLSHRDTSFVPGRDAVPDPGDSAASAVVDATADSADDEMASHASPDDVGEPGTNTPPRAARRVLHWVPATDSTSVGTLQSGGLRGRNDDIRRFSRMTRAAASMPDREVGDGWGPMFSPGKLLSTVIRGERDVYLSRLTGRPAGCHSLASTVIVCLHQSTTSDILD